MGAWGTGLFDNDEAADLALEAVEGSASDFIEAALVIDDPEYIDSDEGTAITVAGVILANRLRGAGIETGDPDFDAWVEGTDADKLGRWVGPVVAALKSVIDDNSELNELWEEAEDEYAEWYATIEGLIDALDAAH